MKKIFKYVPIILGLVMVMSSCGDDDDTEPVSTTPAPSLNYSINSSADKSSYDVTTREAITISITANKIGTGRDLDLIRISQNGANVINSMMFSVGNNTYDFSTAADQTIKNADDETFTVSGTFTGISLNVGTTTYTVTVTDKDGVATTKSFDIVVAEPQIPFTSVDTASIWNINGSLSGSYDLDNDVNVSRTLAPVLADIENTDALSAAFTGSFKIGNNKGGNLLKASASFDFANATVTSAAAEFNGGGTPGKTVTNPANGDVYIFDKGNGSFIAVQISDLDPANTAGSMTNTGIMTFIYKK